MRISDWSSDVCSSDLPPDLRGEAPGPDRPARLRGRRYSDPHTRAQPCFGPSFVEAADSRIGGGSALNAQREIGEYYSRQTVLPEIGLLGQQVLARSKVLVIGAGGLGSPLLMYLARSEEHTSELQSLMRISYAVFCLKKKKQLTIID